MTWTTKICLVALGLLFLSSPDASSQACCTSAVPNASSQLDFNQDPVGLSFRVDYDYNYLNDLVSQSEKLEDDLRERISHTSILSATYMIDSLWGLSLSLPYTWKIERNTSILGGRTENTVAGISDPGLFVKFQPKLIKNWNLVFTAGVKAPTGSTEEVNDETGILYAADLQPGTGSWDGIVVFEGFTRLTNGIAVNAGASYLMTSEGQRFDNQVDYKFGNTLRIIAGTGYSIPWKESEWLPTINAVFRWSVVDLVNNNTEPNTGGYWLHLQPGLRWLLSNQFVVSLTGEVPIYRYLEGTQLSTTFRTRLGLMFTI